MDRGDEMDLVLRSLGADLERDDPELAALLTGTGPDLEPLDAAPSDIPAAAPQAARRHSSVWFVLAVPLLTLVVLAVSLVVPARVTLGVTAMLLILASPLAVCWMCAAMDRADPGTPPA